MQTSSSSEMRRGIDARSCPDAAGTLLSLRPLVSRSAHHLSASRLSSTLASGDNGEHGMMARRLGANLICRHVSLTQTGFRVQRIRRVDASPKSGLLLNMPSRSAGRALDEQ